MYGEQQICVTASYFHAIRSEKQNEEESLVTNDIDVKKVQHTVLIVEDNLEMLEFISKKMMSNYEVLRAMDGLEAIKVLNEAEVDLVISDIMMPNMDGMELLETINSALVPANTLAKKASQYKHPLQAPIPLSSTAN